MYPVGHTFEIYPLWLSVLESPLNLTVEATSSRAILISWKAPPAANSSIAGYWVRHFN